KYLLEKTDQSIQHISEELQFSDAFHFSRAFKKHFGLSPGHHRSRTQ
ncbi:MAG: helix-turn-helix domain-containing protein, partial [Spirochaetia bacterium]|nr:helix-turn-helix domain-containing protein [Spirochaetia bacterium]